MGRCRRETILVSVILLFLLLFGASLLAPGCAGKAGEEPVEKAQEEKVETGGGEAEPAGVERVLVVIPPEDFKDVEYQGTRQALEQAGYEVVVASSSLETCRGMDGTEVKPDIDLGQVMVEDYVAVAFIGGEGAVVYYDDATALDIAREAYRQGSTVGAICIAPVILARAGILEGKRATVSPSGADELERAGATYTGGEMETDGSIVTASGPQASDEFGQALVRNIQE